MPQMEKSKLQAFAKKTATPPPAATALAQKRAVKPPAPAAPPGHAPPAPAAPGDETEVHLHELVEEAAQEAETGTDMDLEDTIAGGKSDGAHDVPPWAEDPQKWAEAAEAVGLGGAANDMYDEPYAVTAYLYKKIGGPVKGGATDIPPPPEAPEGEHPGSDMSKPGAAASALKARSAGKPPAPAAPHPAAPGAAPAPKAAAPGAPPPAKPEVKPPAKPGDKPAAPPPAKLGASPTPHAAKPPAAGPPGAAAPHPAAAPPPGGAPPEEGGGDELKQIVDQAAQEAASNPDPALMEKLQAEPPSEGMAPSWAADQDKWAKAEEAVKPHWADYPDPFVVVAHIYKKMGGAVH